MNGLGFLIWKLKHVFPPAQQIANWKEIGVQWVSIKVRDYVNPYNRLDGTLALEDFLLACKEAGIEVGTWQFVYTTNLARQAELISYDIERFDLKHLMIDAEENGTVYPYAHWKTFPQYRREQCAQEYMDALDLPKDFPVGLCSYRYPSAHPQFPWSSFLNHPKLTMVNPQVYWMFANNPGYQLAKSIAEYTKLTSLPFIPIGAAYEEMGWAPTAREIAEFNELCENNVNGAWGYYRWGQAKEHTDWLISMKVEVSEPPPPPPPEPVIPLAALVPGVSALRIRSGPSTASSTVGYVTPTQPIVEILERALVGDNTEWFRIGYNQWSAALYLGTRYLEEL